MITQPLRALLRHTSVLAAAACALFVTGTVRGAPATIDFNSYTGPNFSSFTAFTEDGFSISPEAGLEPKIQNLGSPSPLTGFYLVGDSSKGPYTVFDITELEASTPFQFLGLDAGANGSPGSTTAIIVTGYIGGLGGTDVGSETFGLTADIYTTYNSVTLLGKNIDALAIGLFYNQAEGTTPFVDNIRLDTDPVASGVPAPAPLALLAAGLIGIVTRRRASA